MHTSNEMGLIRVLSYYSIYLNVSDTLLCPWSQGKKNYYFVTDEYLNVKRQSLFYMFV